jgi:DNA-binding NtrC family response regulator
MDQPAIFIFEPADSIRNAILGPLLGCGFDVLPVSEKSLLFRLLDSRAANAIVLGPSTISITKPFDLAYKIREFAGAVPLVVVVANSSEELVISAMQARIKGYVRYPLRCDELRGALNRCIHGTSTTSVTNCPAQGPLGLIIGESAAMRDIRGRVPRIAASDSNVLITGETGTGKELLAQVVRDQSPRRDQPFVAINCAAIPDTLLESELFGYSKGAFTGADGSRDGKLKAADRGTVFLDEIGDMSTYGQAKILRMIETKEIQKLGDNRGMRVDVRIIAATNQDLEQLARENRFRNDLFFRLNVAVLHLPPLRERKEDLVSLIQYYISFFNQRFGLKIHRITQQALEFLHDYDWPGNVRELKHLLESVFVEGPQEEITLTDLPAPFRRRAMEVKSVSGDERSRLMWALTATDWNKSKAAAKLSWSRMTLYRKMARYNIVPSGNLRTSA